MFRRTGRVCTNLWCHDCRNDFSVDLEYDLDGNHVINCPHCNHEHCRVIRAGVVTEDRWDSRNAQLPTWTYTSGSGGSGTTGRVYMTAATSTANTVFWVG